VNSTNSQDHESMFLQVLMNVLMQRFDNVNATLIFECKKLSLSKNDLFLWCNEGWIRVNVNHRWWFPPSKFSNVTHEYRDFYREMMVSLRTFTSNCNENNIMNNFWTLKKLIYFIFWEKEWKKLTKKKVH
jgi:hypothetical protein